MEKRNTVEWVGGVTLIAVGSQSPSDGHHHPTEFPERLYQLRYPVEQFGMPFGTLANAPKVHHLVGWSDCISRTERIV
jgi:hypothetical protein